MSITRFAPSPTGYIHIGNLRTALFNAILARQNGGQFILRIDDTDKLRSQQRYIDAIKQDLDWLGLHWDRIEQQSTRLARYDAAADELRRSGRLYECFETPTELDLKRKKQLNMGKPPVYDRAALTLSTAERDKLRAERGAGHWRFKLEHERINWQDGILGNVSIDAASVSDPVLIRGDGQYLYTLASVCDDIDYGISHVVRGSDHVTNTATQIQIIAALGGNKPQFAHHSLLTGSNGEALSKRMGSLALRDLRAQEIEPMAILSLLARLGSSEPVELRARVEEVIANFNLSKFGAAPTKFDSAALLPLTAKLLAGLGAADMRDDLEALGVPSDQQGDFWDAIRENITKRTDIAQWWGLCRNGAQPLIASQDTDFIAQAADLLPSRPWDQHTWAQWTGAVKAASGRKGRDLFMPLRKALTGMEHGPDMSRLMPLLQNSRI